MAREITGRHVFAGFALAFGVIIAVNLTLAFNAVRTFPGLEVGNSYVASQTFDADRDAQETLEWDVSAHIAGDTLRLIITRDGIAQVPVIEQATFGRATSVARDQELALTFDGTAFTAPVTAGTGNWNLRLKARADNGTLFQQRIIVQAAP